MFGTNSRPSRTNVALQKITKYFNPSPHIFLELNQDHSEV
jgi:hypothetical protein